MKENYETPLDTAEQIYKSGKTFYEIEFYIKWLKTLDNPWYTKLANRAVNVSYEQWYELAEKVDTDDSIVLMASGSGEPTSTRHWSKELITSHSLVGWIVQKMSPWQQSLDTHILQLDQVLVQ